MKLVKMSSTKMPHSLSKYYAEHAQATLSRAGPSYPTVEFPPDYPKDALDYIRIAQTKKVLQFLADNTDCGVILEMGCGLGSWTDWLSTRFRLIYASDIAASYIAARKWPENVVAFATDAEYYRPIVNFDLIMMTEVLEHLTEPKNTVQRLLAYCTYFLATCPIHEDLNEEGAFDLSRLDHVQAAGDTTGHIWSLDAEGVESLFGRSRILLSLDAGTSQLILARGDVPASREVDFNGSFNIRSQRSV